MENDATGAAANVVADAQSKLNGAQTVVNDLSIDDCPRRQEIEERLQKAFVLMSESLAILQG